MYFPEINRTVPFITLSVSWHFYPNVCSIEDVVYISSFSDEYIMSSTVVVSQKSPFHILRVMHVWMHVVKYILSCHRCVPDREAIFEWKLSSELIDMSIWLGLVPAQSLANQLNVPSSMYFINLKEDYDPWLGIIP